MPEMKGRSLEELDEIFAAKTPTRKFKDFQCIIKDEAAYDVQEKTGIKIGKEEVRASSPFFALLLSCFESPH